MKKIKFLFFFKRLSDWALNAAKPYSIMYNITAFFYKMGSGNKKLARLQSGFLIREIFERFNQKINSTLTPDRKLWLYSAHDLTVSSLLNSLGIFEVLTFVNLIKKPKKCKKLFKKNYKILNILLCCSMFIFFWIKTNEKAIFFIKIKHFFLFTDTYSTVRIEFAH